MTTHSGSRSHGLKAQSAAQQKPDPAARIRRLAKAFGSGPHSNEVDLQQHLRGILEMIGDQAALDMLDAER